MNAFDYFFENSGNFEKLFLLGPKEKITFRDLHKNCLNLAGYLNKNCGKGQNILIISHNSLFFITAYLAILKSGNVAVPLNHEIEQKNLDYISQKCSSTIAFASSRVKGKLQMGDLILYDEPALAEIISGDNFHAVSEQKNEEEVLGEIIFTSGSTGEPKGVMISHKNLIANTQSILQYLKLSEKDIMLVVLPFYYCYGLSLLHTHLRCGGSIILNNLFIMLGGVINDLITYNCTGFAGVPSHFQLLLRKSESFKEMKMPSLRYVTQAGGKLHNTFISEFISSFPEVQFIVMYGQTEATARLTWLPPGRLPEKIGSCGKAIPGVVIDVIDQNHNTVKPGETGEIVASGDNIMMGYYADPESTRNTIINGWLRTGDLGMMDDEGFIYLTARKKEIIKIGGRRISPKEIEEVIVTLPDVIDCTIEGIYDDILGEAIKAVLTINTTSQLTEQEVRKYCTERLASYKVPQIILLKNQISMSLTGKKTKGQGT